MKAIMFMALALLAGGARANTEPTQKGFYTGNELWDQCNSAEIGSQIRCLFYVVGAADAFFRYGRKFCLPANTTAEQVADVVTKFLRDNPERRHHSAESEVEAALIVAFPCLKVAKQPAWTKDPVVKQPNWMSAPPAP